MKETQQKQRLLWQDLILRYCKHHRLFVVSAEEADDFPLFHNKAINRESWGQPASGPASHLAANLSCVLTAACCSVSGNDAGCLLPPPLGAAAAAGVLCCLIPTPATSPISTAPPCLPARLFACVQGG